jgi:hypothetical protein
VWTMPNTTAISAPCCCLPTCLSQASSP